jgi:hypothetical protein
MKCNIECICSVIFSVFVIKSNIINYIQSLSSLTFKFLFNLFKTVHKFNNLSNTDYVINNFFVVDFFSDEKINENQFNNIVSVLKPFSAVL